MTGGLVSFKVPRYGVLVQATKFYRYKTIHLNEAMLVFVTHDHDAALRFVAIASSLTNMSACQFFSFL